MVPSSFKVCKSNSPTHNTISNQGCAFHFKVLNPQLTTQNHHQFGYTTSRSHYNPNIVKTRSFNTKDITLNYNNILHSKFSQDDRRSLQRFCLPFTIQHGSKDDHDRFFWSLFVEDFSKRVNAFYRFSRPHTLIGTLIAVTSVSLLPIESLADFSPQLIMGLLKALIPSLLMNIYVVGLNQLFDVQIDKVNKPNLPLASGEFSMETGSTIVLLSCLLSFTMGYSFKSPALVMALVTSFLLGSAYSIDHPMLRWKRQAFLAAACIVIVRALLVQLAFFIHIQKYVLGRPIMLTKSVIFATAFMCFFATVIALFKDIPDVDGDKHFGIQSFTVRLGKDKVFWLCIKMLLGAYGSALALGINSPFLPTKLVIVLGHTVLALTLWTRAQYVNLGDKASITSFYMFIWKLFYAEYLLIPFLR